MHKAAQWLKNKLSTLGFSSQVFKTDKHPIVFAEYKFAPDAPTILVYGHYDVQPPDPLDLWETGPFTPEIRGEFLYGRGTSDMKGQVIASIQCCRIPAQI